MSGPQGEKGDQGGKGDQGIQGVAGPAPWAPLVAWATGLICVASAPATAVAYGNETYVCVVSHLAGTFAADLTAGKWIKVAAKGVDGTNGINGTNGTNGTNGVPPWQTPPAAWAASTVYTASAPASAVTYGGGSYVCSTSHTSGATFDASKWVQIAAPGTSTSFPNVFEVNGLSIKPGATPASQIALAANAIVLRGATAGLPLGVVSATISTGTVGANGLDSGAKANSTWYAIHAIAKADGTFAGLLSLSATAPTLPSGYTYSARVGWARTDASGNLVPIVQNGRNARYMVTATNGYPVVISGAVGSANTPTYVAIAISGFAPPTAVAGLFNYFTTSGSPTVLLAPNGNYGNYVVGYNVVPPSPPFAPPTLTGYTQIQFHFEGPNIYGVSQANGGAVCLGWEDGL